MPAAWPCAAGSAEPPRKTRRKSSSRGKPKDPGKRCPPSAPHAAHLPQRGYPNRQAAERASVNQLGVDETKPQPQAKPHAPRVKTVDLGNGLTLRLVRVPPGEFLMGDTAGEPDEHPVSRVTITEAFWMAACEISNEQFRQFDPSHDSRYYQKRYPRSNPVRPAGSGRTRAV